MLLLLYAMSCLLQSAIAQNLNWQVQPSVCISENVGDTCELDLEVLLTDVPPGRYCLFLAETLLRCASAVEFPQKMTVSISNNSQLNLVNTAQQILLSQTLIVKSRQASVQRRRLRNPWSLF